MLSLILEKTSLWEYLQNTKKPIFIYGMGDGANKIINVLEKFNIKICGIYASDNFVRGHSFHGFTIKTYSQVRKEYDEFISLLAFAVQKEPMLSHIFKMNDECELYAPDVPVSKDDKTLFDINYVKKHSNELLNTYNILEDETSKKTFLSIIDFKVSGKINYLKNNFSQITDIYKDIIMPTESETYVDLGAYNGDTINEFLSHTNQNAKKIIALEPDKKNFAKLQKRISDENIKKIECYNVGAYDCDDILYFNSAGGRNSSIVPNGNVQISVNSLDNLLNDEFVSIIKFDVEGAEEKAIIGAQNIIKNYTPKILLSAYHKNDDLFNLPKKILGINNQYKIYLRHLPYIPAWETNFYLIPKSNKQCE